MILNQPYPRAHSFNRQLVNAVLGAIIVTVFLRIFQPFGFGQAPVTNLNLFALGYGLVTFLTLIAFAFFERILPDWFVEERWTVGKNILLYVFLIFCIGSINLYYTSFMTGMPLSLKTFFNFQLYTLSITFIVVSALTMVKYFKMVNFYRAEGLKVQEEVESIKEEEEKNPIAENPIIVFKSENEKENLQIPLTSLLYIEAADNYCKFFYQINGKLTSSILRSSLKKIEEQVTYPELFRCHRTYIVQLKNVSRVSGNSQGYRLHFENINESVPVARRMNDEIHNRLRELKMK
jgi:signal transduction histidine kinase